MKYFEVPRSFDGETAVCVASGPSLSDEHIEYIRKKKSEGKCRIFVCNNNYLKVPEADVLFFCDKTFWVWHALKKEFQDFKGQKITMSNEIGDPDIGVMRLSFTEGLSFYQDALCTGGNSGYMQINLALLYGCKRVLLLGYEMQPKIIRHDNGEELKITHWFGSHPQATDPAFYQSVVPHFSSMVPILEKHGLEVINCSQPSAIECFPKMSIYEALQ